MCRPKPRRGGRWPSCATATGCVLDAVAGTLQALVPEAEWAARETLPMPESRKMANAHGVGRELFAAFRRNALAAEEGACTWL